MKLSYFSKRLVTSGKGTPEMKFLRLYDKYFVYNKYGGVIFKYEPDLKYLFSTDYMDYMLFEHYWEEDMIELTEAQFLDAIKRDKTPTAYENESGFYLMGQETCAHCDREHLSWNILEQKPELEPKDQLPVQEMIAKVEKLQEAAYLKAKAAGTLPNYHLFEDEKK